MPGDGGSIKFSIKGGITKLVNKKLTLFKDFKTALLVVKDQNEVQSFIYQFKLDSKGNEKARDRGAENTSTFKTPPQVHQLYPYNFQYRK